MSSKRIFGAFLEGRSLRCREMCLWRKLKDCIPRMEIGTAIPCGASERSGHGLLGLPRREQMLSCALCRAVWLAPLRRLCLAPAFVHVHPHSTRVRCSHRPTRQRGVAPNTHALGREFTSDGVHIVLLSGECSPAVEAPEHAHDPRLQVVSPPPPAGHPSPQVACCQVQ